VIALFGTGILGAAYDFADRAKLAVNADGTGGPPGIGNAVKWAVDQSPNGNHLRNTMASGMPVCRARGIETSGTNYGLFSIPTLGDWPAMAEPFEIIGTMEQLTYSFNGRLLGLANASTPVLMQSGASGAIRFENGDLGPNLSPGLNREFTLAASFSSTARTQSLDGGIPQNLGLGNATVSALLLGSNYDGTNLARIRFKRLLIIGRALNAAERSGVAAWAAAS
jgi:hypothetical protein